MFFAQADKQALIIDERSNGGGQAANYITELLGRRYLAGWRDREGRVFDTPGGAVYGPKVMLIDQDAGSGGDFLPYAFRHAGLGKLVGTRTWGGLIGISANPQLMDGGNVTVPSFRFFTPEGEWAIENEGVAPDIAVELDPVRFNQGTDVQLQRAIDVVLEELDAYQPIRRDDAPELPTELGH
jgi:tricorn protease